MSECRSCGAEIIWAKVWVTDSPIPLDPEPVMGGNIAIREERGYVEVASARQVAEAKKAKKPLYVSHFVTCPDQDKWKRKRRTGARERRDHD